MKNEFLKSIESIITEMFGVENNDLNAEFYSEMASRIAEIYEPDAKSITAEQIEEEIKKETQALCEVNRHYLPVVDSKKLASRLHSSITAYQESMTAGLEAEFAKLHDGNAVWANILCGTIGKPPAIAFMENRIAELEQSLKDEKEEKEDFREAHRNLFNKLGECAMDNAQLKGYISDNEIDHQNEVRRLERIIEWQKKEIAELQAINDSNRDLIIAGRDSADEIREYREVLSDLVGTIGQTPSSLKEPEETSDSMVIFQRNNQFVTVGQIRKASAVLGKYK